jgi:perosamine synthetase
MADLFEDHIPLLRPWTGEEEVRAAAEAIRSGWISLGPKVIEFEKQMAGYVGASYGVATNSCTSALHLTLRLSGIGPGDEVIVPSFTCMATANAIHHAGGEPVFADIDPRTYNLDPAAAESVVTARTRAILVVDQIGLAADMDAFAALARRRSLALIEDGACSLGATYKGKRVGGLGAPTCFSFHPRKMITTGEGGMITTDDAALSEKARVLRSTGASISDLERHKAKGVLVQKYEDVGYNYRLTDIQAAIGLVQMTRLAAMVEQRTAQAARYDAAFAAMDEIEPPYVPEWATHAWTSYLIRMRPGCPVSRDELLRGMAERGISCRTGIQPLHWEPYYAGRCHGLELPASEEAARSTMFLPIFPGLTEQQQDRIIAAVREILAERRSREAVV